MRNLRKVIRNSSEYVVQQLNSIYKKQSQYVVQKDSKSGITKIQPNTLKLHKMQYPQLDKFFVRFYNSKPVDGRVSGKSLAFVVGPERAGKSQYIQKNLNDIKRRKRQMQSQFNSYSLTKSQKFPEFDMRKSPQYLQNQIKENVFDSPYDIIIKKNYDLQQGQLNYTNFIQDLHEDIFDKINSILVQFNSLSSKQGLLSGKLSSKTNKKQEELSLLTAQIVKEIVTKECAPEYVFMYVKDVVFAIIEDKDMIYLTTQHRELLEKWNDQNLVGGQCTCEHFLQKLYPQLIDIIWKAKKQQYCNLKATQQIQKTQIAMKLFYSVFKRIQYENRPTQYVNSWYQTGIQTSNFLFDLLNFLSGTGKYIQFLQKQYTSTTASNQQRQQIKQFLQGSNNYILQGNHVDVLMCLMNLENLKCFRNRSKLFLDFFDHVICRTVNQSNFRKHFPIIVEVPNRQFMDQTLQLGKVQGSNPVIIEIPGYIQKLMKYSNVVQVFQLKKAIKFLYKLGRNPHDWRVAIQNMAKGVTMGEIEEGRAQYQKRQMITAQAKMNRVYTSQRCMSYLNNDTLDFQIRSSLQLFSGIGGLGHTFKNFFSTILFKKPYFQSMLQQNIFYHMYYHCYINYSVGHASCYNLYKDHYLPEIKKRNSWLRHKLWKRKNQEFSLIKREVRYTQTIEHVLFQRDIYGKEHVDLELLTTYYGPVKEYPYSHYNIAYSVTTHS